MTALKLVVQILILFVVSMASFLAGQSNPTVSAARRVVEADNWDREVQRVSNLARDLATKCRVVVVRNDNLSVEGLDIEQAVEVAFEGSLSPVSFKVYSDWGNSSAWKKTPAGTEITLVYREAVVEGRFAATQLGAYLVPLLVK